LFQWYAPELFDKSKEHLHEWDFGFRNYWNEENSRNALDHLLEENIGYRQNLSQEEKLRLVKEKILDHPGGIGKFFIDIGMGGFISTKKDFLKKDSHLELFQWYFQDSKLFNKLKVHYEDMIKKLSHFSNGYDFEKNICQEDVPSLFFGQECVYDCIDRISIYNGTTHPRHPDIVFKKELEDSSERLTFIDTIADIKRSLKGIDYKSRTSKKTGEYKEGAIEKYTHLCNNLVFLIGEYYNPELHDNHLERYHQEFQKYAQPHQTLRFVFADDVINTLTQKGHAEKAEYFAFAIEYASTFVNGRKET
jgi:hypothetical protein